VAAIDRDGTALASLAERTAKPQRLFSQALAVSDEPAPEKAIAMAGEALSRFDGVVNIPAVETPAALLRKVLDVNVVGALMVARTARVMRNTGGGSIVNISDDRQTSSKTNPRGGAFAAARDA
jgi:NAD(P)-dependent dehydrogenase (short-subunit alcohol dehydrogenase family)